MSRHSSPPSQRRISLLVRNLPLDLGSDDVKAKFERYGEVRDVYLPRDYYTQRPRGFGFVEFRDPRDAEEALYHLDRSVIGGREISVVMSKEDRKTPREMLRRDDTYRGGRSSRDNDRGNDRGRDRDYDRSRGRERSSRHRSRSYSRSPAKSTSRSPSPARNRSRRDRASRSPSED